MSKQQVTEYQGKTFMLGLIQCVCVCAFFYTHTINQNIFRLLKAFKTNLKVCPIFASSDLCYVDTLLSGR